MVITTAIDCFRRFLSQCHGRAAGQLAGFITQAGDAGVHDVDGRRPRFICGLVRFRRMYHDHCGRQRIRAGDDGTTAARFQRVPRPSR